MLYWCLVSVGWSIPKGFLLLVCSSPGPLVRRTGFYWSFLSVLVGGLELKTSGAPCVNIGKAIRESRELNHVSFLKFKGPWAVYPLLSTFQSLPVLCIMLSSEIFSCKRRDPDGVGLLFEVFELEVL